MELTFEKEPLLHSLQIVQGVANGHSPSPILSNVLIKADAGKIECAATDMEVGIRTEVDGTIREEGAITVPAKKLADIVKGIARLGALPHHTGEQPSEVGMWEQRLHHYRATRYGVPVAPGV